MKKYYNSIPYITQFSRLDNNEDLDKQYISNKNMLIFSPIFDQSIIFISQNSITMFKVVIDSISLTGYRLVEKLAREGPKFKVRKKCSKSSSRGYYRKEGN